ncbi:LysR family transcriptional regulator [Novosphingobium rosa]|uniref:LysR family transcriptional regulator n=1 Tax=Novosphingobium rosa TaxID=76978 RepID=UPI00082A1C09|nr:LysR family transcriptional regulator [Novosphingobium rosa]
MDWDDVRSFLAIARMRTLSGAARSLGVRQSTMSRRLEALESRAGARLLQRTPAGYELTALGEAVLGNAERMEAEAIAVERTVQGRDVALSGIVRVTTVDVIASRFMPAAIARLQARYPGISVDVMSERRSLSLSRREADLAIRMVPFEGRELVSRRMARSTSAIYGSAAYLARQGRDLANPDHSVVTVLEDQGHMPEARWLAQTVPQARVAMRSNSFEALSGAAMAGLGLTVLPCYLGDWLGGLEKVQSEGSPHREIWLGVHPDLRHMPRIRAVIEALDGEFAAQAHLLKPDV